MTSRECVIRALRFDGPAWVPYQLPDAFGSDMLQVGIGAHPTWTPSVQTPERWEDEWGCIWVRLPGDHTTGQAVEHPLTDYADFDRLRLPDYTHPARYADARAAIGAMTEEKFVIAFVPFSLMHRVEYLRGHQAAWMDPYDHPEELERLLDLLADQTFVYIDALASAGVEGFFSADDWGLQDRLLCAPDIFRRFFLPRYERVWAYAHDRGMSTFLHSCGNILAILPDLRAAGLDVIQMDQQMNMGLERLGGEFGGKLCFWCPVDIQQVMPSATPDEVRAYARQLMDTLGTFNGGFIAKWYPFPAAVQHPEANIRAMAEEFIRYGGKLYA
ncbi:MAG TPA: uroporphyrinogen decarboxylase family protein [Armatimonadota bacterium]|jgi:uroporphyrinogen-III decarboxylase